jgi:hypothetical protein
MRHRSRLRALATGATLAAVALTIFGLVAASAPAGNRNPSTYDFKADPGPSNITFGKNVAYKGQFSNTGKSNWVRVVFSQSVPYALLSDNSQLRATLVYSSCEPNPSAPPVVSGSTYSCPEISSLPAGSGLQKVTLVWQSALLPEGKTCGSPCQLTTTSTLSFKEGNETGTNDTFSKGPILTSLLGVPDKERAGGYSIAKCTDISSNPTLTTNLTLTADNPTATKACEPTLPANDLLNPGLTTTITERAALAGETNGTTQVSEICIADVGLTCPGPPFNFATNGGTLATFVFLYDKGTYGKITQMYEANRLVSEDPTADPNCQVVFDGSNQVSIATCHSSKNGPWRGG